MFLKVMIGEAKLTDMVFSKELSIEGSKLDLVRFFAMMDKPEPTFPIVTP